jgi:hypothetical protein
VTLLSSLLRPQYGTDLEIGSVDGMQGREKDAIVISLVRSNNQVRKFIEYRRSEVQTFYQREVGFLKEKRRLNGQFVVDLHHYLRNDTFYSRYDASKAQLVHCWRFGDHKARLFVLEEMDVMA